MAYDVSICDVLVQAYILMFKEWKAYPSVQIFIISDHEKCVFYTSIFGHLTYYQSLKKSGPVLYSTIFYQVWRWKNECLTYSACILETHGFPLDFQLQGSPVTFRQKSRAFILNVFINCFFSFNSLGRKQYIFNFMDVQRWYICNLNTQDIEFNVLSGLLHVTSNTSTHPTFCWRSIKLD